MGAVRSHQRCHCPAAFSIINLTMLSSFLATKTLIWPGRGFHIGQVAQRASQKSADPALTGSAHTRRTRTQSWCNRHTPSAPGRIFFPTRKVHFWASPGMPLKRFCRKYTVENKSGENSLSVFPRFCNHVFGCFSARGV
jgi:hypothetical protein